MAETLPEVFIYNSTITQELRKCLRDVLTGGNHLANILMNELQCEPETFPIYATSIEKAREVLKDRPVWLWDAWIAWKSIMLLRDVMVREGLKDG